MLKLGKKKKVGLVLSGGAVRGYAHLGVLKVLQENEIPIDFVTGTSVGSIIGALYCGGFNWDDIFKVATKLKWKELASPTLSGLGLVKADKMEKFVEKLLGDTDFSELKIPFKTVAVDISRAREVVIDSGPVARAVRASSSVPVIFEPLIEDDQALVDGGVMNNLPCALVREMGAQKVIAVDLNAHRAAEHIPVNLIDVSYRSFTMLLNNSSSEGREDADILIQPELYEFSYHDLSQAGRSFREGGRSGRGSVETAKTAQIV